MTVPAANIEMPAPSAIAPNQPKGSASSTCFIASSMPRAVTMMPAMITKWAYE